MKLTPIDGQHRKPPTEPPTALDAQLMPKGTWRESTPIFDSVFDELGDPQLGKSVLNHIAPE